MRKSQIGIAALSLCLSLALSPINLADAKTSKPSDAGKAAKADTSKDASDKSPKSDSGKTGKAAKAGESAKAGETAGKQASKSQDSKGKLSLEITSIPASVKAGAQAQVDVKTESGAAVDIAVKLKSGASKNAALKPQTADATGKASWQWTIAKNTSAGDAEVTVTSTFRGKSNSVTKTMKIEK
jgi:hypothetical protein